MVLETCQSATIKERKLLECPTVFYALHLVGVSPMVWRRLLVRDDTSIAALHGILQLTMGWENQHLHCLRIFGTDYGPAGAFEQFFGVALPIQCSKR